VTVAQLDSIFPYICFAYGAIMTLALNLPWVARIADERLPAHLVVQWRSRAGLGLICLFVGAAWILQNLWFS